MDVRLSREQRLISQTAARLGAEHAITGIRDLPPTPKSTAQAWESLAAAGLLGLKGEGAGVAAALVAEELAKALCLAPYVSQGILAPALLGAAGAGEGEAIAAGTGRYSVLLSLDLQGIAGPADAGVVFDAVGAEFGLSLDAEGVVRRHPLAPGDGVPSLDRTRRVLTGITLDPGEILGQVISEGERVRIHSCALTAITADQLGLMERALDLSIRYAGDRRQFGRVIGANQALAHVVADAAVLVEAARSCVWHAAWALDEREPLEAQDAARQAKAFCANASREVLEAAVQVHGGLAITWEHELHLLLRRVLFDAELFGGARVQQAQIAARRLSPALPSGGPPAQSEGISFADSPQEAEFREGLRCWLAANAPGEPPQDGDARMAAQHEWHRALAVEGLVGLSFAREYGGQGRSLLYDAILNDELAAAGAPAGPAINHITNAIRLFGTEEQKRTQLPGMLDCTVRWCQGFSEPGAGSDLASLQTRAIAFTGDDGQPYYRIDGQKLWTSEAMWADWCLLLARTEAGSPEHPRPHQQLSMLMLPMSTPGVQCRPVRTAYGSSEFAEVFFTEAIVPASRLLGAPGQGWEIAMALLGFERGPADMGWTARLQSLLARAEAGIRSGTLTASESQREALAYAWVELEALRLQVLRSTSNRLEGSAPGPEGSLDKLLMTRAEQRLNHVLLDLYGAAAVLDEAALFPSYVWSRAQGIFGGAQQIQRDLVAQRVLGLPRPGG